MNFNDYTKNISLNINSDLEDNLIKKFCNTETENRRDRLLSTWMQGYIYAASLGIIYNRREKLESASKTVKKNNFGSHTPQFEYLLSCLLHKKDILVELELISSLKDEGKQTADTKKIISKHVVNDQFNKEDFYKHIFSKLANILDEYMNGGLHVLQDKINENQIHVTIQTSNK